MAPAGGITGSRHSTRAGKIMTKAEIEANIRKFYSARVAGNVQEILDVMATDVHFVLAGNPEASPVARRLRGADKLHPHVTELVQAFKFNAYEIVSLVVEGPNAAVHARANVTSMVNGETVDTDLADFFTFEDGRIATFVQFCDTALAGKLATKT
jgi:ketosteroid isomerase-like protein